MAVDGAHTQIRDHVQKEIDSKMADIYKARNCWALHPQATTSRGPSSTATEGASSVVLRPSKGVKYLYACDINGITALQELNKAEAGDVMPDLRRWNEHACDLLDTIELRLEQTGPRLGPYHSSIMPVVTTPLSSADVRFRRHHGSIGERASLRTTRLRHTAIDPDHFVFRNKTPPDAFSVPHTGTADTTCTCPRMAVSWVPTLAVCERGIMPTAQGNLNACGGLKTGHGSNCLHRDTLPQSSHWELGVVPALSKEFDGALNTWARQAQMARARHDAETSRPVSTPASGTNAASADAGVELSVQSASWRPLQTQSSVLDQLTTNLRLCSPMIGNAVKAATRAAADVDQEHRTTKVLTLQTGRTGG